ncbi:TPA: phage head-tail connector protein [Staphylococcus aureus]|uniref:phage head-tail connector protein n=1 Tax=Staphylococcus aureus TaxID=1280 RepID=UPI001E30A876|nr:phage head-tail connector protein [Staphylococcus aureus]UFA53857.1 phage head-tail adapter protein [Staphylococcus aureus]HDN3443943.1 phage head-tail connector protein [Staphylococcus aureus]HDN3492049.1 phage head-tail connector protein [Staphylococcus aureus]HDZ8756008.1 phage head-tail connector protein [Staphylococcus aureus]HEK6547106.1 phage head-tail connector protein [Staphylococcus aureus]
MTIDDLLVKFKSLEKIDHNSEDEYLKQLLKMSYERIKNQCGVFDLENLTGQELILMRTRYAYQDLLEHFNDNYRSELIDFSLSLMEVSEDEESIQET